MTKPKIYVLIGAPNSGKSTWTKKKLQADNFVVISTDDIIEDYGSKDGLNYGDAWSKYNRVAASLAKQAFDQAVKENKNIIYDQTNMKSKKRRTILEKVNNYEKIAVIFDVPTKELLRRNIERNQKTGKFIPVSVIEDMLRSFDPVNKSEGFDSIMRVS